MERVHQCIPFERRGLGYEIQVGQKRGRIHALLGAETRPYMGRDEVVLCDHTRNVIFMAGNQALPVEFLNNQTSTTMSATCVTYASSYSQYLQTLRNCSRLPTGFSASARHLR